MKPAIPLLVAAGLGAAVLLRPVPPPAAPSGGWSSPLPERTGRSPRPVAPARALVYVAGEVVRPGVYALGPDARTRDALALAGGAKARADLVAVNLAARLRDGEEIVVPLRGAAPPAPARASRGGRALRAGGARRSGPPGGHRRARRGEPPPAAEVDINTADAETLSTIPGIGSGLAERIVAFRAQNGAFTSVDELLDVAGITEHRLDAMIPYVVAR